MKPWDWIRRKLTRTSGLATISSYPSLPKGKQGDSTTASDTSTVTTPDSSHALGLVRFADTSGKVFEDSVVTLSDEGSLNIPLGQKYKINGVALGATDVSAEPSLTKGNLTATGPLSVSDSRQVIGGGAVLSVAKSAANADGYLSKEDWSAFNAKEPSLTKGSLLATAPISLSATRSLIGGNSIVSIPKATSSVDGYLDNDDWSRFDSKADYLFGSHGFTGTGDFSTSGSGSFGSIKLDPAPANGASSGIIVTATVDTNAQGIGAPLYMNTDGHFDTADADGTTTAPCVALALETGTGTKKVLLYGVITNTSWNWSVGPGETGSIYLSTDVGVLTQTQPSGTDDVIQKVGWALSADTMMFCPSLNYLTHV